MQNIFYQIKKNKNEFIIGALLLSLAFFTRAYNFSDWLVFKADQSRDAFYAREAVEKGIKNLSLLGPKIEVIYIEGDERTKGESLKLGPAYYYEQYLAAKIMRTVEPWVFALPDLLLSTLALALFYFFARIYFSKQISLAVTFLLTCSFYAVQYSRFAWNPNQILFWELLFVLGLYKSVFEENKKRAGWWLIATFLSYALMSQLHVVALFGFLPLGIAFWFLYRPRKIRWAYWLAGIAIPLMLYSPVIISDVKNNGDNIKRFIAVLQKDRDALTFSKNIEKLVQRQGEFAAMAITSFHDREIKNIEKTGAIFYFSSLLILLFIILRKGILKTLSFFKIKNNLIHRLVNKPEIQDYQKNSFIVLIVLWASVYLVVFYKIVTDLNRARYFLVVLPVAFIFVAFWFHFFQKNFSQKISKILIMGFVGIFGMINLWAITDWYHSLANFKETGNSRKMIKLGYYDGLITLNSMEASLNFMVNQVSGENKEICFMSSDYQYNLGLEYLGALHYPEIKMTRFNQGNLYNDCSFFVISRIKNGKNEVPKVLLEKFEIIGGERTGSLNVWRLDYRTEWRERVVKEGVQSSKKAEEEDKDEGAVFWKDVIK